MSTGTVPEWPKSAVPVSTSPSWVTSNITCPLPTTGYLTGSCTSTLESRR
jgi:hypothetical protein